jgi:1,4-alpha-glucan branching enzyme
LKKATYIALQIHAAASALLLGPCSPAIAGGSVDNSALIPPYFPHDQVRLEGMSPDWVKSLVIVELRIETATEEGTFDAAISKLDHYAEMGVNALWICPVYDRKTESGYNNGYKNFGPHTVYPALTGVTSPDESYKVIRRFVEAAHQRNIRVFLDIISWGVAKDAPLVGEQPDFWIKLPSGEYREAYDGYLFDWSKPHFREWFVAQAVKLIEETKADGFRVDLAPDTSAYHFKEVRDALYSRGHKIAIFSEMPSEPRGTFDFAQMGVNGWTERPAYGQPEVFAEQKKRFGSLHDSSFMFRTNLVDAVKGGIGIGRPELQEKGEGGLFRFYAATPLCHDGYGPFVKGNLVRFGYIALSPFLPIWWIGEEWNNPKNVRKGTGVMYFNNIDWKAKSEPVNAEFFEEVKKVLRVRRMFPTIFEHFSESLREANIAKIDSTRDGTPNPLQSYMRYAGNKAVLVVPNYESTTPASTYRIKTFSDQWGQDQKGTVRLTNLMTGEVLGTKPWAELREFEATIEAESLGVFLLEMDESTSRADTPEQASSAPQAAE